VGDPNLQATALCRLGDALRLQGDIGPANDHYAGALAFSHEENFKEGYCYCLQGLGAVALARGDPDAAVRLFAARARIRESVLAEDFYPLMIRERERLLAQAHAELGDEGFNAAWSAGRALTPAHWIAAAA
jgi:hypothetical protein